MGIKFRDKIKIKLLGQKGKISVLETLTDSEDIMQLIKDMTPDEKLEALKICNQNLSDSDILKCCEGMTDQYKLSVVDICNSHKIWRSILNSLSENKSKLDLFRSLREEDKKGVDEYTLWEIAKDLKSDENIFELNQIVSSNLSSEYIVKMVVLLNNDANKLKFLMMNEDGISIQDCKVILKHIKDENVRAQIVEIYEKKEIILKCDELSGELKSLLNDGVNNETKDESLIEYATEINKILNNVETKVGEDIVKKYIYPFIMDEKISSSLKVQMLKATEGVDYIDELENVELMELDEKTKEVLMLLIGDLEYVNKIESLPNRSFNLPESMTIGVEIENVGGLSGDINNSFHFENWEAKPDASLGVSTGTEVVSPILHPTFDDAKQVYTVTELLKRVGQAVSEKCGGHIHIGADFLTSKQAYTNLLEIWCNTEKILYSICNDKNEAPREGIARYAKPISPKIQEALEMGRINLSDDNELDSFVEGLKQVQGLHEKEFDERYSGLNFLNINNGKNTIEFRLANGTLNPDLWMDNINLFGSIVAISEELAQIQQKGIENDEDRSKIEMLERLKEDISEEDKLKILLELVGVEPEAYMDRYESNMRLMDNEQERKEAFEKVKGPIDIIKKSQISSKDIAQATVSASALMEQEAISIMVKEMEHEKQQENVAERT